MSIFGDRLDATEVPVSRYVTAFGIAYLLMMAVYVIVVAVLEIEPPSSLSTALFMGATLFAAEKFAKENKRRPISAERWKFGLGSTAIGLSVQFILLILLVAAARLSPDSMIGKGGAALLEMSAPAVIMIFALFGMLYFGVSYFFFRWGASWSLKASERKGTTRH